LAAAFTQDFIDRAFLGEVLSQAEYCLDPGSSLQASLTAGSVDSTYRALHSLLSHAANLSKLLWPAATKDKAKAAVMQGRAARLLNKLSLQAHIAPILSNRDLRNHLEHFDERLDTWAALNPPGLVDRNVGPLAMLGTFPVAAVLRHYDPIAQIFIFAGDRYHIGELLRTVAEVRAAAIAARSHT
jgi:hypothetical protein